MRSLVFMTALALTTSGPALGQTVDPRLREVTYDRNAVVTVPVRRGVVTHVLLAVDDSIADVATGLGGDCSRPEATWCIGAQPGGRSLFVKPKSAASGANNVAVVTDKRSYAFRFVILSDGDSAAPVYRLEMKLPVARKAALASQPFATASVAGEPARISATAMPSAAETVASRLQAAPTVANSSYSIADGAVSGAIVPSLIFDDGRFTYFRFAGNEPLPAVFEVLADGSESLVNSRMEGDLLVIDRVSRQLVLRAGSAVVGVWNEAFDPEGLPTVGGATVAGVERAARTRSHPPASGESQ